MTGPDGRDRLSNLAAVTDTALTALTVEDMLVELLERLRDILLADTAAVLLREGDELVARVACGLEDEVRQGVTVPIGSGFAGAIAARKRPVVLNQVDETTVTNPILWEKGVQAMLGVPLLSHDHVIGVLHVGRLELRPFTDEDADLLMVAGERVAAAIQSRQLAVETAAARLLERSLQPTRLPTSIPGLHFAGRYVPAENRTIGGDWYDAFVVPSGQLWLVTGDVAGHGLNAAVIMGRIKSALRAYALEQSDPVRVLELTDRKVQHFEIGTMATVICATIDPPYDHVTVCTAGHPPPVLAVPGTPTRLLELPVGPPLGVIRGVRRRAVTVPLPLGALMLLYTDGLIERRTEAITEGLERLRATVFASDPETACRTVMHDLIGSSASMDDTAVLAVQRTAAAPQS